MKKIGYLLAAVLGVLIGWWITSKTTTKFQEVESVTQRVTISLNRENGKWGKGDVPPQVWAQTGDEIVWTISNETDQEVDVSLVEFMVEGRPCSEAKKPLNGSLKVKIAPRGQGEIRARVKPKAMLLEDPAATLRDEYKRLYQIFSYKLMVGNETIDPEIRIRET